MAAGALRPGPRQELRGHVAERRVQAVPDGAAAPLILGRRTLGPAAPRQALRADDDYARTGTLRPRQAPELQATTARGVADAPGRTFRSAPNYPKSQAGRCRRGRSARAVGEP